ncbi:glyoxalase, partial [Acinetobacter baumannii]
MNTIRGIDEIVYGADDLAACKQFFQDWDLTLKAEDASGLLFETLNGCRVRVKRSDDATLPPAMEAGPTLREVIWG